VKLGEGGRWESGCLKDGTLRFGYLEFPMTFALPELDGVRRRALAFSKNKGVATFHATQVRQFYEADETVLWITFHADVCGGVSLTS